jgi:predicted RNase H-like HicB family nuclease
MVETIALEINLQAFVRRDTADRCVAACPQIGVVSQGRTVREAKTCLQEAVELWFESCIERGVLERALREANFHPSSAADHAHSNVRGFRRQRPANVLGTAFTIRLRIPGYEAVPLLSTSA